jgi:hypothetical protein
MAVNFWNNRIYNNPYGVSANIEDPFGGVFFNQYLIDSGSYIIPEPFNAAKLTMHYNEVVILVELTSFAASLSGSSVKLNWITATETNNAGFEILRFAQNDNEWETIGFVSGFGTTTEPKSYSFTDDLSRLRDNVTTGKYKYRLKQIDYDGTFEYSNEVEVEVNLLPKEYIIYQNYPNPFNPVTKIKFSLPKQTRLKINLYNVLGELVQTITEGLYEAGNYEAELNAQALPSGIYIYKFESSEFVQSKKVMLVK